MKVLMIPQSRVQNTFFAPYCPFLYLGLANSSSLDSRSISVQLWVPSPDDFDDSLREEDQFWVNFDELVLGAEVWSDNTESYFETNYKNVKDLRADSSESKCNS